MPNGQSLLFGPCVTFNDVAVFHLFGRGGGMRREELELVLGWLSEFDRMVLPSNSSCLTPQLWLYGTFFVFSENTGSFIHFLELIFSVTQLYCFFIF